MALRFAWRSLWRYPATTVGAVLALGLGIGATSTMFGLLNAVLLRPLPFPESERLVEIYGTVERQQVERRGASFPDFYDWRAQSRSFDGMAAWYSAGAIGYGGEEPESLRGEIVDGPYFELLGVSPLAGRVFQASDHQPGAAPVVVIGERLWERRFGRKPEALGQSLRLDSRVYTVVGVVPAAFTGRSDSAEIFRTAASAMPPEALARRGDRWFPALARLRPGVTLAAAQGELDRINAGLAAAHPDTNEKRAAEVVRLADEVFGDVRPAVSLLFGAVALVLLLACANVASLLLARGEARRREFSLRRALGADDRRLVGLLLAEGAWLALLGGGLGWLLAGWAGDALLALSPVRFPSFAAPALDWRVLLFVSALCLGTALLMGLAPLRSLRDESLGQALREGAAEARGGGGTRPLRWIVVGEVALTVTLLVGASLLLRSFGALLAFDPGFDPKGVLSLRVQLPAPAEGEETRQGAGTLALLDELGALPGVRSASLSSDVPLAGASAIFYSAEGAAEEDATTQPRAYRHRTSPGHFRTLGLELVEGRDFEAGELRSDSGVVIVSAGVARRFWPGESAIGRRVKPGRPESAAPWLRIVGVVKDANLRGIPRNPTGDPDLYFPFEEGARSFALLLRTDGSAAGLAAPVRTLLRRERPGAAVFAERTLEDLVEAELAPARFLSWLLGVFASIALTLSVIGIYGLLAYWVRLRTREIGIRSALGAGQGELLGLVLGQALGMAAAGLAIGAGLAFALGRAVESQLYGVRPLDALSFVATAAIMLLAAGAASLPPALRALRVDPLEALRTE
ncbi:MAG: ABC transporter permease [Vicinamibacteria bacterium]